MIPSHSCSTRSWLVVSVIFRGLFERYFPNIPLERTSTKQLNICCGASCKLTGHDWESTCGKSYCRLVIIAMLISGNSYSLTQAADMTNSSLVFAAVQKTILQNAWKNSGEYWAAFRLDLFVYWHAALMTVFTRRSFTEDLITSPLSSVPAPNTTHSRVPLRMRPHSPLHLSSITRGNPILLYSVLRYGLADRIREVNGQVGSGYTGSYYFSIW